MIGPKTLFGRLLLVFIAFGAVMAATLLGAIQVTHNAYHLEADQTVNRDLARRYVAQNFLLVDAPLTANTLHHGLAKLSAANPDVDIYLLDREGAIVAASLPQSDWQRSRVALEPVRRFLAGDELPILGENPRESGRGEIFSAATMAIADCPAQYLYIVLHRGEHAAGAARLRTLYAWGEGAGAVLFAAVLAWGLTLFVVRLLTQRLSGLELAMRAFETRSGIEAGRDDGPERAGDEVDRLNKMFQRLASRVEQQMRALQSADARRREVLANVSHDLRTPLTTLRAHLETLAVERSALSASERREYVEVSLRQTKRLIRLVEQLLEVAKLDSAQVALEIEPFSLADLVQDVVQKFALAAHERGVAIEIDLASGLPWVKADIGLIERVLDNLIENALRYSPRGARVHVALVCQGEQAVRVAITDSGPGLKAEELARIFERFYRADPSRSGAGGHAGLGLSIVKSILELHGTTIQVDGRPGLGARFFFDLPALRAAPASVEAEPPERAFGT